MKLLADKIAVVTGAGSGIGKAIALALGERGATLVLVGRRRAPLDEVQANLMARGAKSHCHPADVADRDDIARLAEALRRDFDGLDVMVHSAGLVRLGDVAEAPADDLDLQYRTNLLAPYLLTQATLPLIRRRQGQIVFVNSSAGVAARAHVSQYAATKHALKAVADSLRAEVNGDGIRVLSVFPGQTATPAQERLYAEQGRPYRADRLLQPEDVASVVAHSLCLPRTAEVTDLHIRPMTKPD
ncbi:MAG: SDR family NAD(P)-dependent oxidoreductase [Planctomycetia bacterium]|nr:SDR family NAD(P)-dependent oxidoreductase [Planctomycetia bacterium]